MAFTLGMTGMDASTEDALRAAFHEANTRFGGRWQLASDRDAAYVVVDMDSMYGPMSWLRLHADGKTVIGLTSAARTQADFHLPQPPDGAALARVLAQIAPALAMVAEPEAAAPAPATSVPAGLTPAPQARDQLPEEQPQASDEEQASPELPSAEPPVDELVRPHEPPSAAAAQVLPAAPTLAPHVPHPPAAPEPQTRLLAQWLAAGGLAGRLRVDRDGVPLWIDTERREYFGSAALKPLIPHVGQPLAATDFVAVGADWEAQVAPQGAAQPLSRLLWLGALVEGGGALLPGFDPEARYQLLKWPQTEREYPKHFRIATAMMKGPATLAEIAEASGVTHGEVCDFVNANLATGFADIERAPEPEPETPGPRGLFGRLRGR